MSFFQCSIPRTIEPVLVELLQESVPQIVQALTGSAPVVLEMDTREEVESCDAVYASISFVGDLVWSLMLGFPRETAVQIVMRFAGFEIDFDSPDMGDAIGEVVNIAAGDMIARLEGRGIAAMMSLPVVARGHDVAILLPTDIARVRIAFHGAEGPFWAILAGSHASTVRSTHEGFTK